MKRLTKEQEQSVRQVIEWEDKMSEWNREIGHIRRHFGYEGFNLGEEVEKMRKDADDKERGGIKITEVCPPNPYVPYW